MTKKIAIHEATAAQLRYYASTVLGLADVKPQHTQPTLIAKIHDAIPDLLEIEVPDDVTERPEPAAIDLSNFTGAASNESHFSNDPRVEVIFSRTSDVTKPKLVQISVNGEVVVAERGKKVNLPYRHFLANLQAVETVGRETDEVNESGMPVMEFADQPSYPMQHVAMPPREDILAWHKRMGSRPESYELELAAR